MTTIYELNTQQKQLIDELFFIMDSDDEDDKNARQWIENKLCEIDGVIEAKLVYVLNLLAETSAIAAIRKDAARRAQVRAKRAENAENGLREFIKESLVNSRLKKVDGDFLSASVYMRKDIQFTGDVSFLPSDLIRHKEPEPNMTLIKAALKEGRYVADVIEVETNVLRIS